MDRTAAAEASVLALLDRFKMGDRGALAQAITMIESTAIKDRIHRDMILSRLPPPKKPSVRIAISGPPGVGKSTFIDTLGQKLLKKRFSIAILPIDPTSEITLGSIMADKTRMRALLCHPDVFIRPSPSKGVLGGVAPSTRDVIFAVEAFGFDAVIIETVGVGQSETMAYFLGDHFVLLMEPGAGDQLQAMKKGILERAHFILVNKADGDRRKLASSTASDLTGMPKKTAGDRYVSAISALQDMGIDEFLTALLSRHDRLLRDGELIKGRNERLTAIFMNLYKNLLIDGLMGLPSVMAACQREIDEILPHDGPLLPAAERLADEMLRRF